MDLRIFTEPQQGASYADLLAVALAAERLGFSAFFRSDHFLKMGSASGLPEYTDAWTTLAGLARDTTTIRLGTLVTPVTFRAIGTFPAIAAQVDHMSSGRLEIGLGAGWYEAEHEAYGLAFPSPAARYDLLEDQLAILEGVWSAAPGAVFEHAGHTVHVRLEADPLRPAQRPRPPLIMGGRGGPRNAGLAARHADEFNVAFASVETTRERHDSVRAACAAARRDPASMVWSVGQVLCCGENESEVARRAAAIGRDPKELREKGLAGTPDEIVDRLGTFTEAGSSRCYLQVLDLSDLDHLQLVAERVAPALT
ncbi:MAG TPA: LLM class flavin-dependent oxidoreductase [Acidimicrobiales bacterium]|nr:LLM class flavin-dependent oxidoreductase [Acidimicrobiales bacterium]